MEKVFVHPECPFSENTFKLLAEFYENPGSDFYREHKKDFLKYVEEPVKYILSEVEEQLPDFIKKYIAFKQERFGSRPINFVKSTAVYRAEYYFNFNTSPHSNHFDQLRLTVGNQKLTFDFPGEKYYFRQ